VSTPPGVFGLYDWKDLPAPRVWSIHNNFGSVQAVTGIGLITAINSYTSSATTPYVIRLHDGTDSSGLLLAVTASPAASSVSQGPGLAGIPFRIGVYAEHVSGTGDLVVTYVPLLNQL